MKRRWPAALSVLALSGLVALEACGGSEETSAGPGGSGGPGGAGSTGGAGGGSSSSGGGAGGFDPGCPAAVECAGVCCASGELCALGTTCAIDQGPCVTNDDCGFDSYCLAGECVPYGLPGGLGHDPSCKLEIDIEAILPAVQCAWTGPPPGDTHPDHVHVMSTPVVVDFDFDDDPATLAPSVVVTTFPTAGSYSNPGVLRVIRGSDCAQQFTFADPADATMSPASVAVGDLDGAGRAEIVAAPHRRGQLAVKYHPGGHTFARLWRSGTCVGGMPPQTPDTTGGSDKWSGPSIHDLDDDGSPEIVYGATVYSANGCIASSALGFPGYSKGYVPVVADVDEDGKMELVQGDAIHEWSSASSSWVVEPYFTASGATPMGQVAVADMGDYPLASFGGLDRVEVVVVSSGQVRVQTLEGTVVFGPVAIPGGGTGGPPTIADFDGDGRREFASAGGSEYVVFDLDCVAGGDPLKCASGSSNGVLWSQPSKDQSSNVTGSSVFDFDADGAAEAVYADECFLRIYEGATGAVLYSAARSSGTTFENPVIVDVDGDYRTEIVSAVNDYAGSLGCPATDPLMPTSPYAQSHGIVILRDEQDRWAASRPVWNQHAYAVTHVGDHGEIPPTSQVSINWKDPTLNNFRQNVQGGLDALGVPDLTAGGDVGEVECNGTVATIEARVCNRGTLPMVSGTEVAFLEGDAMGPVLCTVPIPVALQVEECMVVSCQADLGGATIDVFIKVDPQGLSDECWEGNNTALYQGVACGKVPS